MGLPYGGAHAGQLLFGPADGYLYMTMGDGAHKDDPYNFAQNKKSLLGKILRFDVDNIPSEKEINDLGLWGNYSIPRDNPYVEDKELGPEIWALGFRNPWRCSFDSERPSYFICGDPGQDEYEEIDIVTKGGNYGWRVYEGFLLFHPQLSPGGSTLPTSINPIFPVMGYTHSEINNNIGSASIIGGYFYRSLADPCMYGRYIYMDLYGEAMWAGSEHPLNSGNFTSSRIGFRCANDSPIPCNITTGSSSSPSLGFVFSLAQDNRKDLYILTSKGIYRVTRPSRCNLKCSKEIVTSTSHSSSPMYIKHRRGSCRFNIGFLVFFVLVL
ncbi:Soluble quinoprotein glucose/sorbosone dehydrogenase [Corchorus capsularis]|uniref:Soluble quinoprotein glucose/sorbosone dehydrogenase n=1 Tax=Corchorus capsularis TaxID=210143 RepID=A0A1R3JNX5_COCAP|nr:Soluble quinoprotein glucose/sorbosone dehydrogenase [Corchorus capsularis]